MPEVDQSSGTCHRPGGPRGFSLGRRALSGWALTAVLGLVGFGATPGPLLSPVTVDGTVVGGSAAGVAPRAFVRADPAIGIGAPLPMDTVTSPSVPVNTATSASAPTPAAAPMLGTDAIADAVAGGTPPATGAAVPAGPAAQLRQAAFTNAAPDARAVAAIRTALAQIGLPYVWGGDGPSNGDAGFDCSGLTTFSYGTVGVPLPRTAHTQYNAGPHVPAGVPLQPGDLVFYGTSARVHHVGMYLGAGRMVNAPTFGRPVQVAYYRYRGDDYLGATRPAVAGGSLTTGLLPYVDPLPVVPDVALAPAQRQQQAQERVFRAPPASLPAVLPKPGDAALPSEPQSAAQAIAESDAVTGGPARVLTPQPVIGPVAPGSPAAGGAAAGGAAAGGAAVGSASAGSASAGSASAGSASAGSASAGSASAGSPAAGGASTGSASAGGAPAGSASSGGAAGPGAGTATSPSAPATSAAAPTSSAVPTSSPVTAPGAVVPTEVPSSPGTSSPVPTGPAGTATSPTSTTSSPAASLPTSGSPTSGSTAGEKAAGSTTTLAPTSSVRSTTPKATTSRPAVPKPTTTPRAGKTVTSATSTAVPAPKAVTTTSKPAAKTADADPTTTKTSASTTGKSSTAKTSIEKTSTKKTSEEKSSSSDEGDD